MSKLVVQSLLKRIEALPQQDRLLLEERLARQAQAAWDAEVRKARRIAKRRGIDQAVIDRAVEECRYGQ